MGAPIPLRMHDGTAPADALGRTLEYYDMPTVRRIVRDADAGGDHFSSIVIGIVASPAFQMKQIPGGRNADQPPVKVAQVPTGHAQHRDSP